MNQIINGSFDHDDLPRSYRAPSGMIYDVVSVQLMTLTSTPPNIIYFINRQIEEGLGGVVAIGDDDGVFAQFNTSIDPGTSQVIFSPSLAMKVITVARQGSAAFVVQYIIEYRLRKATEAELIWEFVSRGKNP